MLALSGAVLASLKLRKRQFGLVEILFSPRLSGRKVYSTCNESRSYSKKPAAKEARKGQANKTNRVSFITAKYICNEECNGESTRCADVTHIALSSLQQTHFSPCTKLSQVITHQGINCRQSAAGLEKNSTWCHKFGLIEFYCGLPPFSPPFIRFKDWHTLFSGMLEITKTDISSHRGISSARKRVWLNLGHLPTVTETQGLNVEASDYIHITFSPSHTETKK